MSSSFSTRVEYGLKLSKRLYYGKQKTTPPVLEPSMSRSSSTSEKVLLDVSYLPTAVMAYAMVEEPEMVDNPDVPSYQPYVHGKCVPPALVPLHMHEVSLEVDCWLDHASVGLCGSWRLHCVKASRVCDCCIVVPLGEQGSLLGVEVHGNGRAYKSSLITAEDAKDKGKVKKGDGAYIKGNIYSITIPQIDGGSKFSVKVCWSQKIEFCGGEFCLNIPFSFPKYVNPFASRDTKREKIVLNVNSGFGKEILFNCPSHALKAIRREVGKVGFLYESEVSTWSSSDFVFSYGVPSKDMFGGVIVQSPFLRDPDDRQMLCLYVFPGNNQPMKIFRKEIVFLIDISASMKDDPLEKVKTALFSSLSKLTPQDSFNIIAFNTETFLFSPIMEPATKEGIVKACNWLNDKLTADGGTNILLPIKQAIQMLKETTDVIPIIFLITDGSVQDERDICNFVKDSCGNGIERISPRICTFGIGTYCNHYFLKMLAQIGRGYYGSANDSEEVSFRLQELFTAASSIIISNITLQPLESDALELYPSSIPDLSCTNPLIISGRYNGNLPSVVTISGILADMSRFTMDLKAQKTKDLPLDKVFARRQIDILTANAWSAESEELKQKVAKISIRTSTPSEYTCMVLLQTQKSEKGQETILLPEVMKKISSLKKTDSEDKKIIILGSLGIGFGNLNATAKNIPPGIEEPKSPEAAAKLVKAATNCCSGLLDRVCCMCCIKTLTYASDRTYIAFSQLCAALACFECINCCFELCECDCV